MARFISTSSNSVIDVKTGRRWYLGLQKDMCWTSSETAVNELSVENAKWRLPTIEELQEINVNLAEIKNSPFRIFLYKLIWSSQRQGSFAQAILFGGLADPLNILIFRQSNTHVLAVQDN